MKRYTYGQNFSAGTCGRFQLLTPIGFLEVAPGDTVSGKFTNKLWTDTTFRPVMNRTYHDIWAFYVPYRLLWDDFPEFVATTEGEGSLTPPTTTGISRVMFEAPTLSSNSCLAWNRRAYNLIYNKFFRITAYQPEAPEDNGLPLPINQRPSTFHEACMPPGTISSESITVPVDIIDENSGAAELSLDALRQGFADDHWRKVRDFYGEKYSDYLRAMSIKVPWTLVDEPELIGKAMSDLPYRTVNTTFGQDLGGEGNDYWTGDPAGYFIGTNACRVKPTFCPEHGIIVMVAAVRMDILNIAGNGLPHLVKNTRRSYYTPEEESRKLAAFPQGIFGEGGTVTDQGSDNLKFDEYRKPANQVGYFNTSQDKSLLYWFNYSNPNATPADYITPTPDLYDDMFTGTLGSSTKDVHYVNMNEVRMIKKSPVQPQRLTVPIR